MKYLLLKLSLVILFSTTFLFANADGPDFLSVRGVTQYDVLWMHPVPEYKSRRIGKIPHNATCVKNLGCKGTWCKVSYGGIVGWVNGKYLGEGECRQSYR